MAVEVRLPQLGETMEEATIVGYMVNVGDRVKKGDCVFEIETDKATMEVESPVAGFVKHILAEQGRTFTVGEPVLILGDKDEEVASDFINSLKGRTGPKPAEQAAPPKPAATPIQAPDEQIPAVPARGSQTHFSASGQAPSEVKLGATIPVTKNQKITAERMLQSKREMPCFYLTVKADVTDIVKLRARLNKTGNMKISYNDFIINALAIGLEKFAIMTGQLAGDTIQLAESINIGLAISVPQGLIVPVIKDADKKNLTQIARDSRALVEKAQNGKLLLSDLQGGCITVSNLGGFGTESFIPIVVPGQCSILGVGRIMDTCVPDNDGIVTRKLMTMTLSVDHKVANGTYAGQFLDFVRKLLEDASNFE